MHMQPIYRMNGFVTREGNGRAKTNSYIAGDAIGRDGMPLDVGMDISIEVYACRVTIR